MASVEPSFDIDLEAAQSSSFSSNEHHSIGELRNEKQRLDNTIQELQLEIAELQRLSEFREEHEKKYTSASRDARKMYGDITPGDVTHKDVTLEYTNHFKYTHRNMPNSFLDQYKYEVWRMTSDIVQASFDVNRDKIVTKVMNDLDHALNIDEDPPVLEDNTRDLHRAFKEFVKNMNPEKKEDIKRKVLGGHSGQPMNERAFRLVMDAIIELDPADYKAFVTKGQLRDRVADYRQLSSSR